jgi:hypothetical protein
MTTRFALSIAPVEVLGRRKEEGKNKGFGTVLQNQDLITDGREKIMRTTVGQETKLKIANTICQITLSFFLPAIVLTVKSTTSLLLSPR